MATNADLVQAIKDWKDEIRGVDKDYRNSIAKLSEIESNFKKSFWEQAKPYIPTVLQLLGVILFFICLNKGIPCGTEVKGFGVEINRTCK